MEQSNSLLIVVLSVLGAIASIVALALVLNPDSILLKASVTEEKAREKVALFEEKYGSSESLLREIDRTEASIRDSEDELRELRKKQNQYYGNKAFAGPQRLNDWRARASNIREDIEAKKSTLKKLKADYELWLVCKRKLSDGVREGGSP